MNTSKMTPDQLKNNQRSTELRSKFEIARKIITTEGFYNAWSNSLNNFKNGRDAFNSLNTLHYNVVIPNQYKFKNFFHFLETIKQDKFKNPALKKRTG